MIAYAVMGRTALAVALATSSLTACSEYMDRKNTIAFSAGNAVQTNVVTHVIDPWPVHSANKNIAFSGERMARAVRCYQLGPKDESSGGGSSGVTVNVNAGAGGGASAEGGSSGSQC